jgi:hypothetical protein
MSTGKDFNSTNCAFRARECIPAKIRHKVLQDSNFACSICGKIPIDIHHIKQWAKDFSNDEKHLIPICLLHHRAIHGEGGPIYSEGELYDYKTNPVKPRLLSDKFYLERKRGYSFFIGSNFVLNGERADLIGLPGGYRLISIDTTQGVLRLSVIAEIKNGKPVYLIENNELMVDTTDVWDMRYSGSSLKIWRNRNGKGTIFIDLIIKSDIIVIKRMNTTFDGKPYLVYKPQKPKSEKLRQIADRIEHYEKEYGEFEIQIALLPNVYGTAWDMDFDAFHKSTLKDIQKHRLQMALRSEVWEMFNGDWHHLTLLEELIDKSALATEKSAAQEEDLIINKVTNCLIKNVTRSMIKKGSLTHNECYPDKGGKRRTDYESTVKKGIYRSCFFTVQKSSSQRQDDHPRRILCHLWLYVIA